MLENDWLTEEGFLSFVAVSESTPGPLAVNMATFVGASQGGFFGALCAIPYLFAGGVGAALSWWISGIPFDIAHCLGNAVSVLVLYNPLYYLMKKLADFQRRRERLRSK